MFMRKFIVSDIHGNGDIYDSIMGYLENLSLIEDVELYINGDLIDRGLNSFQVLEDVFQRMNQRGKLKIHYLGGNHELMMYQSLARKKVGRDIPLLCNWRFNGGSIIANQLNFSENRDQKCEEYKKFLGDLNIYHIFDEEIASFPLLLVHAQAPNALSSMKIGDCNWKTHKAVWTRDKDEFGLRHRIGKKGYFTIVGHTPVLSSQGVSYHAKEQYLNIDGGCAGYAVGQFEYAFVPLIEVKNSELEILIFNHNNEIVKGSIFDGKDFHSLSFDTLQTRRVFLNHQYDGQEAEYKRRILDKR